MSEASEREKSRSYAGGAIHSQIGKDLTNDAGALEAVAGEAGREGDLLEIRMLIAMKFSSDVIVYRQVSACRSRPRQ